MYHLYDATDDRDLGLEFATLDDVEAYLDNTYEAWDYINDTDEGAEFECSDGEEYTYIAATWEDA